MRSSATRGGRKGARSREASRCDALARVIHARRDAAAVINQRVNYGDESTSLFLHRRGLEIFTRMAFLVAGQVTRGGAGRGAAAARGRRVRNTREERHDQDGPGSASEGREEGGGREQAETRLGTAATPERAINDSGAEFRDAEILSV